MFGTADDAGAVVKFSVVVDAVLATVKSTVSLRYVPKGASTRQV